MNPEGKTVIGKPEKTRLPLKKKLLRSSYICIWQGVIRVDYTPIFQNMLSTQYLL
jgi:hypothetical protein